MDLVTWYIVFTAKDVAPHPVHIFLKSQFRHCYCFRQIGDHIYFANPTTANIDTKIYQQQNAHELCESLLQDPSTKILKFKYKFDFKNKVFSIRNISPTCVSIVKMFLGIRSFALTPFQLYKFLKRQGGKEITREHLLWY